MTPQQIKTLLDSGVLQAYAEGKPVQFYDEGWGKWCDPKHSYQNPLELTNKWRVKPENKTMWVNIYSDDDASAWPTKDVADRRAVQGRIACIQISYEEGEGL